MVMLLAMFGTAEPGRCWPSRPRRPVFLRECTAPTTHSSVGSYFLSRFTMEAILVALQVLLQCAITYLMMGFRSDYGVYFGGMYALSIMAITAVAMLLGSAVEETKVGRLRAAPIAVRAADSCSPAFLRDAGPPPGLAERWAQYYLCSLTSGLRIRLVEEFEDCGSGGEGPTTTTTNDDDEAAQNEACHARCWPTPGPIPTRRGVVALAGAGDDPGGGPARGAVRPPATRPPGSSEQ
jgi:ABC-2 type transporter